MSTKEATAAGKAMEPRVRRESALFTVFTGIFVTVLVLIPVLSSKVFSIGPFDLPGGTILFPITFIFNDIFTEVYGYARSRRIIWTGLACQVIAALALYCVTSLPPAAFWPHQAAYESVLGVAPRIALASLSAYFFGEFANSVVISRMKYRQAGGRGLQQGWRFVASTLVGEAVDSIVFMSIAYIGVIPASRFLTSMTTLYVAKVGYEILALPLSLRISNWVKAIEELDVIDRPESTDYSPFRLGENAR